MSSFFMRGRHLRLSFNIDFRKSVALIRHCFTLHAIYSLSFKARIRLKSLSSRNGCGVLLESNLETSPVSF